MKLNKLERYRKKIRTLLKRNKRLHFEKNIRIGNITTFPVSSRIREKTIMIKKIMILSFGFLIYLDSFDTNFAGIGTADFVGSNFTPHVLIVNAGEDVMMKIMTFSQQGSRAICILSANGCISNVTLRQSTASGGTLTYEGRFEILSLTGSFMEKDSGGTRSKSGGMSVCLAGPDGRVFGGGLAGLFLAAGPVQVIVGTFIVGQEQSHLQLAKERWQRFGSQPSSISFKITAEERKARFERLNKSAPTSSYPNENRTNTVQDYYTNSVNQTKDPDEEDNDEDEDEENNDSDDEIRN